MEIPTHESAAVIKKSRMAVSTPASKDANISCHLGCDAPYVRHPPRRSKAPTPFIAATEGMRVGGALALTVATGALISHVMLQHNDVRSGRRAHLAHAAVVGLHTLCCGLPALALLAAAFSGATSGVALFSDTFQEFHDLLHRFELSIVVVSAALVAVGAWLEVRARRIGHAQGFPWLFAVSVICFFANIAVIAAHRGAV